MSKPHLTDANKSAKWLPLSDGAVLISPDRIFPVMARLGSLAHGGFVDLYSKAGSARNGDISVRVFKHCWIDQVIGRFSPDIIVDTETLLLNERIWNAAVELQARGKGDRSKRAMQSNRRIVCFGHCADLVGLTDASSVGNIWLDNIDNTKRKNTLKVPDRKSVV